jgi:dynein heavy chain
MFRPVMMIVPDLRQITQIMLFSEGFENAAPLALKVTVLYTLAKSVLSKQFHYDFGLRSLKTVLVICGSLKREFPDLDERVVVMRILRDNNMPKFTFEDVPLFLGMISDLFPGMDAPRVSNPELKEALETYYEKNLYRGEDDEVFDFQVNKAIQLQETQDVRWTNVLVGPTGGGKTLIIDSLVAAKQIAFGTAVKLMVLNPKSQPGAELYGLMDPVTRDWTDGILSCIFRTLNQPLPAGRENEMRWILYDGDLDAHWVENMNSVMDDNKLLTLPNGERIRLLDHVKMLIEVFDMQYASPATVSRCGMIWVDPKNVGYRPFFERWLKLRALQEGAAQEAIDRLAELFDQYLPAALDLVLFGIVDGQAGAKLLQMIPITALNCVRQLASCLQAFLPVECDNESDVEGAFVYAIVWSVGAGLMEASRKPFDAFLKKLGAADPGGSLYDYYYDVGEHAWVSWESQVPKYQEPVPFLFHRVTVPTTDSVLYTSMLRQLAPLKPILFVGDSGTAKTLTVSNYLAELPSEGYSRLNLNFSSRTTSLDVQNNLEANVDKRSGNIYGPTGGKKLIVFIDDMNMPAVDHGGTQQPVTMLQTLMSRGFIYDRAKIEPVPKLMRDIEYLAAMGPPGGGRNETTPRFVALFNVLALAPPSEKVLQTIFSSIVDARLAPFSDDARGAATKLTSSTLRVYNAVLAGLPATPSKFHYVFNLRDVARVFEGVCLATIDTVKTADDLVRLWRSEVTRSLCDRLISPTDLELVSSEIAATVGDAWSSSAGHAMADPLLFGDFSGAVARIESDAEDARIYQDLGGYAATRGVLDGVLELHNMEKQPMNLVMFEYAIEHITRTLRYLSQPRGHAMMIGVGGSGKLQRPARELLRGVRSVYAHAQARVRRGRLQRRSEATLRNAEHQKGDVPLHRRSRRRGRISRVPQCDAIRRVPARALR